MSLFLTEVHQAKKNGKDINEIISRYHDRYRNVYIYNDFCIKHILTGGGKDLTLVTNLVNAALRLTGSDCIVNPELENPVISGGLIYKDIEQDIVISRRRKEVDSESVDRIGLEFQHIGYDAYNNRDFSAFEGDKHFSLLQKRSDLSTFAPELFVEAGEHMKDDVEVAAYIARQEERKKSAETIAKLQEEIASLKAALAKKS